MQSRREGIQAEVTKTKTLAPRVEKLVFNVGIFGALARGWGALLRAGWGLLALHIYCSTFIAPPPVCGLRTLGRAV